MNQPTKEQKCLKIHFLSAKERDELWRRHAEVHRELEEKQAKFSPAGKIRLRRELREIAELMRKAKALG